MKVLYGPREIEFTHIINSQLKYSYISVDSFKGVILKSPPIDELKAQKLILRKARWIIKKLQLVTIPPKEEIVSGSWLYFSGRTYYTRVIEDPTCKDVTVSFDYSSFKITLPPNLPDKQKSIEKSLESFYREQAEALIPPRIAYWSKITGLTPTGTAFHKNDKEWGSCSPQKIISFHIKIITLPIFIADYIILHELCHLKYPNHGKEFKKEVSKFIPLYKEIEEKLLMIK